MVGKGGVAEGDDDRGGIVTGAAALKLDFVCGWVELLPLVIQLS